ncbi:MAG: hypothetical protein V7641_108 [Blastocatellia bacterium]
MGFMCGISGEGQTPPTNAMQQSVGSEALLVTSSAVSRRLGG